MLFNSYEFIFIFLPITLAVYFCLNKYRFTVLAKIWLVAASLFFYGWWNVDYIPLLVGSMVINFFLGKKLGKPIKHEDGISETPMDSKIFRKFLLSIGIMFNLLLLGYFKYADFIALNINSLIAGHLPIQNIVLPLAISFVTFQQIAYLVDRYRNEVKGDNFINYALFITFFPQIIAGPIVHHKEMMPQFNSRFNFLIKIKNIYLGAFIFIVGLFKKVVIADTLAGWATPGFDVAEKLDFYNAWATSLSYTFQIYFDFSGYTDMAIGAALLFNIRLPQNFNSPYKATNIQDFWRRWHMTLSRFLREYLYIPLGGNRKGELQTYANLLITFVIGGLWHGASWMFIIWGGLHGIALIIHRIWTKLNFRLPVILAWFITFNFINLTWIFFRAKDIEAAQKVLHGMLGNYVLDLSATVAIYDFIDVHAKTIALAICFLIVIFFKNASMSLGPKMISARSAIFSGVLVALLILVVTTTDTSKSEFLYFNF